MSALITPLPSVEEQIHDMVVNSQTANDLILLLDIRDADYVTNMAQMMHDKVAELQGATEQQQKLEMRLRAVEGNRFWNGNKAIELTLELESITAAVRRISGELLALQIKIRDDRRQFSPRARH